MKRTEIQVFAKAVRLGLVTKRPVYKNNRFLNWVYEEDGLYQPFDNSVKENFGLDVHYGIFTHEYTYVAGVDDPDDTLGLGESPGRWEGDYAVKAIVFYRNEVIPVWKFYKYDTVHGCLKIVH